MKWLKNSLLLIIILVRVMPINATQLPPVELTLGMTITHSVQIKKSTYLINGTDSNDRPVILIKGDNIIVDFNNASLHGSNSKPFPNQFYGLAILIKGHNITLKNARISGYKVAVMAEGCTNLSIINSNFSYNYRQQLQSTWLHEDVSDWMSYHHNENDEWLRYGAGIYLKDCNNTSIRNNTITGGQCALMMMRCNDGLITDNDFSFNSAIGIGMYRSNRNTIIHNKLDFNVRGYSHGFYNRGQDSAGLLVFEQCSDNVFAYNSVTHGGDGFFLWAGQTTMDTGEGGCNDNYVFKNDFSYAPTNGVEITFSRNHISHNTIKACDNGIWGGYSYNTKIDGNFIQGNKIGIAIEHGQENEFTSNILDSNKTAVKLWARKQQPTDWGYAQKKDTRSRHYHIYNNALFNNNIVFDITLTDTLYFKANDFRDNKVIYHFSNEVHFIDTSLYTKKTDPVAEANRIAIDSKKATIPKLHYPSGRDQIRITEWGPYNFRYPILFLKKIDSNQVYYFDVLGPTGKWKIINSKAVQHISLTEGRFPAEITAQKNGTDVQLELKYMGEAFTDQFGKNQLANTWHRFSFRDFQPDINWNVNWYNWDAAHDPNKNYEQFKSVYNNSPVKFEQTKKLDYTWWGAIGKNLPADSFALVATGTVEVEKGFYQLSVTADDLVKIFVDDRLIIDFWDVSKYKYDEDTHHQATVSLNGKHTIRVEQADNTGYATLIFKLIPLNNK